MKQYLDIAQEILDEGVYKDDRTGTGTVSYFSPRSFRHDLREGFPLLTTKKMFFRGIAEELIWFLSGSRNIKPLVDKDVKIWDGNGYDYYLKRFKEGAFKTHSPAYTFDEWKDTIRQSSSKEPSIGDLGNIYGHQWRNFGGHTVSHRYTETFNQYDPTVQYIMAPGGSKKSTDVYYDEIVPGADQVKGVIESLKNNPDSRRHIINAWNAKDVKDQSAALPPCHVMYMFAVEGNHLHMTMVQRSADWFLGSPFNIASSALLLTLVAREVGLTPARLIVTYGDAHIYQNHIDQIKEQLTREPLPLAELVIHGDKDIFNLTYDDFEVKNYQSHKAIKGKMSV